MGPEDSKSKAIDRFQIFNVRVGRFLWHGHLDRGYVACSTCKSLEKDVCKYLRASSVNFPVRFIDSVSRRSIFSYMMKSK
jgi:hypothetical protein